MEIMAANISEQSIAKSLCSDYLKSKRMIQILTRTGYNGAQYGSSVLNAMSFARLLGNIFKWINKRLIICMLELAKMYSQGK